jgi:hypothetical protein
MMGARLCFKPSIAFSTLGLRMERATVAINCSFWRRMIGVAEMQALIISWSKLGFILSILHSGQGVGCNVLL